KQKLLKNNVPILTGVDTRQLVLRLRDQGTPWGALLKADGPQEAIDKAPAIIQAAQQGDLDWAHLASQGPAQSLEGQNPAGPRVAVINFGSKNNILRELKKRCREIRVFPSRTGAEEIKSWNPDGILLSNGPGDPQNVQVA